MTKLVKPLTRETAVIDYRKNKPLVVELTPTALRIKTKGDRKWFIVGYQQLLILGARGEYATSD